MALDASIGIGREDTYGTLSAVVEGYEGQADSWKTTREFIESVGFRAGMQTARADRRNVVNMGGEGELEVDLLDAGAGSLLTSAFDKVTVTDTGGVKTTVLETSDVTQAPSFSAQMVRPGTDGVKAAYKHKGCVATEWSLTAEVEEAVKLSVTFDFQDVEHTTNPAQIVAPTYPAQAYPYDWTRTGVELSKDGSAVAFDATSLELTGDLGLKTDRRFLRANELKKKPIRNAVPTYEGTLEGEFSASSLTLYEAFIAGELCALKVTFAGVLPGSSLTVECPAIQFTGESPEAATDEVTVHNLPFRVLDPGDGTAAIKLTYVEPGTEPAP
ncbi:major tail protein [Streptomyces phage Lilbooboo]|uniref:Major tail protein n=1 Tax=Streptomyces phage Lilbooboo TaxID=2510571 RepID=A0A411B2Y1_9CAUD|nr:major tail protein [Streptomyces phage Lilbooboo]QAX94708.1 major tail protein [Streptomyces phage Lilbooboo]